jgi:hypothetical protein
MAPLSILGLDVEAGGLHLQDYQQGGLVQQGWLFLCAYAPLLFGELWRRIKLEFVVEVGRPALDRAELSPAARPALPTRRHARPAPPTPHSRSSRC